MKSPKDIKKALACVCDGPDCEECAYAEKVNDEKFGEVLLFHCSENYKDALEYIQKLESRLAQVERERDAAVHDLPIGIDCNTCKYSERAYEEQPCSGCKEYRGPWYPVHWEWRGVCPENTKEDSNATD